MKIISSYVISESVFFITEGIDYSTFIISPSLLFLLSLHRFKQLISPFNEGIKLNRFRIAVVIAMWLLSPIVAFCIVWYRTFIKYEKLIEFIFFISSLIITISLVIINILIIYQFKSKLKDKKLNKRNLNNERKAILCTLSLTLLLLIVIAPFLILHPFVIYNFEFTKCLHGIYYSIGYFYCFMNPVVLLIFNRKLRINFKSISSKCISSK